MTRITQPRMIRLNSVETSLRSEMIDSIHSHNIILNKFNMRNMNWIQLLANIHPIYRKEMADKLKDSNLINKEDYNQIIETIWGRKKYSN
jgi:hypothetical protein